MHLDLACGVRNAHTYAMQGALGVFQFPSFMEHHVTHGFSTRAGGISTGCYATLNLSFTRTDARACVLDNYRRLCQAARINRASLVSNTFEHGTVVRRVNRTDCGRGFERKALPPCDGLVTDDLAVTLVTGHADCMALFFYDPNTNSIGLAHAGWRGAYQRMATHMVEQMRDTFHSNPEDLLAGIGPCICGNCFEVDEALGKRFQDAFEGLPCVKPGREGKAFVNLPMVAAHQMLACGMKREHITWMDVCTYEDPRLYSHRRDHGNTGAMAAFMSLT